MFTLGIPNGQYRRATQVLQHERSVPVNFEFERQDDDFYIFSFDIDYDGFKDIVLLLKGNGVTTIGADDQLTEKNIMKLEKLLEQNQYNVAPGESDNPSQGFSKGDMLSSADDIIAQLKYILEVWEKKEYASDKERYEEYYMDIEDLVTDYEENQSIDRPDTDISGMEESYKLKDFFINEQEENPRIDKGTSNREENVKIEIPGVDGETNVKIKFGNATGPLEDITISFMSEDDEVEQYSGLDFEYNEDEGSVEIEDHGEEGKDLVFVAVHDDATFFVDVSVERDYDQSGNIQEVDWDTLKVEFDQETESLKELKKFHKQSADTLNFLSKTKNNIDEEACTEEEIREGTCGYGVNGELGDEPAGPGLMNPNASLIVVKETLKNLLEKL